MERKRILAVDDTEIDRIILKSILARDFDITEANSGNMAFEYITTQGGQFDAVLLDICMPHINGFDVLRFLRDKGLSQIPVFMVTAEPTRDNVEKAVRYNIAGFITKPFVREDVLRRLRSRLGVIPEYDLKNDDLKLTLEFISDLEAVYKTYLKNYGLNDEHYRVMSELMRIMLTQYSKTLRDIKLTPDSIKLISKAAYFCDIGQMFIPDKRLQLMSGGEMMQDLQQLHTLYGANLIRLNNSRNCEYFVEICSSMCLHHHERFDGTGYPDRLEDKNNSIFNQLCRLADEFEEMRSKFYGDKSRPVKFVIKRLSGEVGLVDPKLYALLEDCERQIIDYFNQQTV